MKCGRLSIIAGLIAASIFLTAAAEERVTIMEWDAPTPKSFPHDPAVGPDGALWYTGLLSEKLGRLDPRTGIIIEYPLKTADPGLHGLTADKEGRIWFTAGYQGYIGMLDPGTGEVIEYAMPDPAAEDPHSLVFDNKGMLWFTVRFGNFAGRLDPRTGNVTLQPSPTPGSRPYGIAVSSTGTPFFCEFGTNKIGSIDPETFRITEYLLPEGARPRRLTVTHDNMIYYTDYERGFLGRLDPMSGRVDEWLSPGGPGSKPFAIAATTDGMIWYSESGMRTNTIVRFDPVTKDFLKWPVPSGGGVIRNMAAAPGGDIYIACSGVNKVGVVRTGR